MQAYEAPLCRASSDKGSWPIYEEADRLKCGKTAFMHALVQEGDWSPPIEVREWEGAN